ncbi:MAG: amidase, partial [Acidimicrobiia bacterium]|nr:amidase [Acidimicrobiia bacterium]
VNPKVNAIVEVLAGPARASADAADRAVATGERLGPLHGVPVTVKQNIDVAGTATTLGLTVFKDAVAPCDGPPVERLREAGAIVIGRTNLPDVALRWHTDSGLAGATLNPWDPAISPGGSSGGEAVSLATGMSPLGIGTDLGGSVRIPAGACGVVSLKPTWGRVADVSVVAPPPTRAIAQVDTTGPLARSVADLRIALSVLRRPSDRDPRYRDVELPEVESPTRFAITIPEGTHPDVRAAVSSAAMLLEDAGWTREDVAPPDLGAAFEAWLALIGRDVAESLPVLRDVCGDQALQFLDLMVAVIPSVDDAAFESLLTERRAQLIDEWARFQTTIPLVVTPVLTQPTFAAGADLVDPIAVTHSVACVPPVNLLGLPAAVVPAGESGGHPIGVQLIGPAWREDVCLAAAGTIETARGARIPIDPR